MNQYEYQRNELLAEKVIKGLKSRNMDGYYAASKEDALRQALELIPEGSSVTMGGGESVHAIGLSQALKDGPYNFIDRDAYEDKRAAMLAAYDADVYLAALLAPHAHNVDVRAGPPEAEVAHYAAHGVGVDAQPVGTLADGAVEVKSQVDHLFKTIFFLWRITRIKRSYAG
jgi:hypothetical protein